MFAYGADIGWLKQFEDMGYVWNDENGIQKDVLDILNEMGVNALRFRVFVGPPENISVCVDSSHFRSGLARPDALEP